MPATRITDITMLIHIHNYGGIHTLAHIQTHTDIDKDTDRQTQIYTDTYTYYMHTVVL